MMMKWIDRIVIIVTLGLFMQTEASAGELKMLSWNLFMIPQPIVFNYQADRSQQVADFIQNTDYDVIVFQELFSNSAQSILESKLKERYPHMKHLGGRFPKIINSGVMVISKYPFNILDKLFFSDCATTDCFASKGMLLIEIQHPNGRKVQVAATHFQAWDTPKAVQARRNQVIELKGLLDRHHMHGIAQFLVGDLNVDGLIGQEFDDLMKVANMETIPLSPAGEDRTWGFDVHFSTPDIFKLLNAAKTKMEWTKNKAWLDHVWFRTNGSEHAKILNLQSKSIKGVINGLSTPLSDHHAVEAHIRF